eukprot:4061688-Prymnesium_polylepis.1
MRGESSTWVDAGCPVGASLWQGVDGGTRLPHLADQRRAIALRQVAEASLTPEQQRRNKPKAVGPSGWPHRTPFQPCLMYAHTLFLAWGGGWVVAPDCETILWHVIVRASVRG